MTSETILVRLSSKTATVSNNGSFTSYIHNEKLQSVKAVSLKTCTFRNTFYNVSSEVGNNIFSIEINGTTYAHTISEDGWYTTTELIAILKPLIEADAITEGGTLTDFVQQSYSDKLEITFATVSSQLLGAAGSLNWYLGNTDDSGVITAATTYVFTDQPSLGGVESVTCNVKSKNTKSILTKAVSGSPEKTLSTNSLGVIPVTAAYGLLNVYNQPDVDAVASVFNKPDDFTKLEFKIRASDGRVLVPCSNDEITIEMLCWL
jgi:hypothetical protein